MPASPPQEISIAAAFKRFTIEFDFGPSKNTRSAYLYALRIFEKYLGFTRNLDTTHLLELDVTSCRHFDLWLGEEVEKNKPRYAERTRVLCKTVLDRFINYWRNQGQISFSLIQEKELEQVSRVHSKKTARDLSTVKNVDDDFGERMLKAARRFEKTRRDASLGAQSKSKARFLCINGLRALALVSVLRSTALRISDTLLLQRVQLEQAVLQNGYLEVTMVKTGDKAHVVFDAKTRQVIAAYLAERGDASPWIFIQHGREGRRRRKVNDQFFLNNDDSKHSGYGMRLGPYSARAIIAKIAAEAGYQTQQKVDASGKQVPLRKGESGLYITPHAFRHWHAQTLKKMGMPIEEIQSVLGHASPDTTKKIYAPLPDLKKILDFEARLHASDNEDES